MRGQNQNLPVSYSVGSSGNRDGRGLGQTLFNIGKLTLSHLLPTVGQAAPAPSTAEKISNSLETSTESSSSSASVRPCTTPDGGRGQCRDLGNCPALLLQLDNLRKSICFQSLFVPGVCCPDASSSNPIVSLINQLASSSLNNINNNNNNGAVSTTTTRTVIIEDLDAYTTTTQRVFTAPVTLAPTTSFLNPIINTASPSQSHGVQSVQGN